MDNIDFSVYQLLIKKSTSPMVYNIPSKEDFYEINSEDPFSVDNNFYTIKISRTDDYFWLSVEYGNPMPHRKNKVNITTNEEMPNSRTENEVELNKQIFFLYCFENKNLYLSDNRKKNFFVDVFRKQFDIEIKSYYKNMEEMIKVLKEVNKISFAYDETLFSTNGDMGSALINLTGIDSKASFELKTTYRRANKLSNFLRKLDSEYRNDRLKRLVVCGRNEANIDIIYNTDSFREKISIPVRKNEEGIYSSDYVKEELIRSIKSAT